MNVKRMIQLAVLFIIISLLFQSIVYYKDRTSGIDGNVAQTFIKAFFTPQATVEVDHNDQTYNVPLPKFTYPLNSKDSKTYLTMISLKSGTVSKKINDYYYTQLPESGWELVEQLGSAYILTNGEISIISTRSRLMLGVELITFSVL
ncbi:MAG: hypothetical protein AB7V16_12385 [Vulcanibacillus sp.]